MGEPKSWTCSICGGHATVGAADEATGFLHVATATSREDGRGFTLYAHVTRCPNPACRDFHFGVSVHWSKYTYNPRGAGKFDTDYKAPVGIGRFAFLPTTSTPLSNDVPASVKDDYREAHLIRRLSPKAAATLARRALQGMVRDFWQISRDTLHQELVFIKAGCAADLYQAMMDVKSLGNIGAHLERDISVIVDIAR